MSEQECAQRGVLGSGEAGRRTSAWPPTLRRVRWPSALALALVLLVALSVRLYRLTPLDVGLLYAQDADEGVYATTAQLALQGYVPYRDFFTPMPPVAIYLFMAVLRVVYHPWGSAAGMMALRYSCVFFGLVTVGLVYLVGEKLGGSPSGFLAAMLVAVDGIVVAQDRRAMLEAPTNLFSLLAVASYLLAVDLDQQDGSSRVGNGRKLRYLLIASGAFAAAALLTKGTAIVPVIVVLVHLLVRRRWRDLWWFVASVAATCALLAAPFLLACPIEFIKQNYVFHMLRPWDGTVHPLGRLVEIWQYPWSWATVRLALLGIAMTGLAAGKVRHVRSLAVVYLWGGLLLAFFLTSRTYWATYFSALAIPFSLVAGTSLDVAADGDAFKCPGNLLHLSMHRRAAVRLLCVALVLLGGYRALRQQYTATRLALEQSKPVYPAIADLIDEWVPPGQKILVFEPNYTFMTSHPPAGAPGDLFWIDSYGEMLYENLRIRQSSFRDLLLTWATQDRQGSLMVFHGEPAQTKVRQAFEDAAYLVLDGRALKQLTGESIEHIKQHSTVLGAAYASELRARVID